MRLLKGIFFAALLIAALPASAQPRLPVVVDDEAWHPLRESVDPVLQGRLEAALQRNRRWTNLINNERMAVGLVDITDPANPRFARVNGNSMIYAASLPKIAILLAAEQAIEDGLIELTPEVDQDMHAMIRRSSNTAATAMIDRVGLEYIEQVLSDDRYMLYDPEYGGGLWVGKAYAKSGERIPDPIAGLSHGATVSQVSRFYYLAATGRLVSPQRSRHMLDVLVDPGINHKFVYAVSDRAPRARMFRKSGTWRNWHADSILVWGDGWRRYILVSLVEDANGEKILRDLVPVVERVLKPEPTSAR
ncbi:MAG: serine hydrolase [Rhodothermales bacterium]|nr:serine hydrolase [Rhodothermales bacterium]MBO6778038.1 serine hydrolase [Rhodothermales bacterium]